MICSKYRQLRPFRGRSQDLGSKLLVRATARGPNTGPNQTDPVRWGRRAPNGDGHHGGQLPPPLPCRPSAPTATRAVRACPWRTALSPCWTTTG